MRQIVISGLLVASIGVLLLLGRPALAAFSHFTWAVKDQNGNPLGGAVVHVNFKLSSGEWGYAGSCSTNSSGRCSFTLSRKSPCELRGDVEYQGYTGSYSGAYPNGAVITVIIDIPPPPEEGITVTGCVYHPCDPIGPVVGAHVYVLDPTTWEIIAETTTGADGCFTLTSPKSGPGYNLYIYSSQLSISGVFPLPQESGDMGTLELNADCGVPPEEEKCEKEFPEEKTCCPIEQAAPPDPLLVWLINEVGGILNFLAKILHITFTLQAGELDRSEWLPADANFHLAQFASSIEECDDRRIALPEEKPEKTPEGKMCPGAALRLAPPNYRPTWFWASNRTRRLKWQIPLNQYKIYDPWQGDGGKDGDRNRSAHHPLKVGAEDEWLWLINTPGTEEVIAAVRRERLAQEVDDTTGVCYAPKIISSPKTDCGGSTTPLLASPKNGSDSSAPLVKATSTTSRENGSGSSQTLGVQLAQKESPTLLASREKVLGEESCIPCGCKVLYPTPDCSCMETNSCMGEHSQIGWCGYHMWGGCICGYTDCDPDAPSNCQCCLPFCGGVVPPPPPPSEEDYCNPPYPAADKKVCSDTGTRPLSVTEATRLILDHYLGDGIKLYPEFTYLDRIAYRLAGIWTEKFQDYKEAGIGGVFNAFLPPGWTGEASLPAPNEYPILDAPAPLDVSLVISVHLWDVCPDLLTRCVYNGQCCDESRCWGAADCGACEAAGGSCQQDCCCWSPFGCFPLQFSITVPLEVAGGPLRIRYLGSQTEALRVTQQWLAPPL